MMNSIRTNIPVFLYGDFVHFAKKFDMESLKVGTYTEYESSRVYLCYAYSDLDTELTSAMSVLTLKYGSVAKAYGKYCAEEKVTL